MIKICYLADGQSIHTKRWCAHFASLGFEIHLITFRPVEMDEATVHFVDCGPIAVEGNNKKILLKIPAIRKLIKRINPDIVHAHYATSYGLVGALSGRKPLVVTALGSDVLISPKHSKAYRLLLKFVFKKASWITAMSEPMRKIMIDLGAKPEKTETLIFGINDEIFFDQQPKIMPEQLSIISTRNFEPVYNIDILIDALALLRKNIPEFKVHIAGTGSLEKAIKQKVTDLGLEETCCFYGRLAPEKIADLLRQAHLFVSVSSSDGNNISLNEAMACGCCCVVSDIEANRQWIIDGENGYLIPTITKEDIAKTLYTAAKQYLLRNEEMKKLNMDLIGKKANWKVNMDKVRIKYQKLCSHD